MTGLDKIVHQILAEADDSSKKRTQEARAEVAKIAAEAQEKADAIRESILKESEEEVAKYQERITSSVDLNRRTAILEAKQSIIAEVLQKSYDRFCGVSDSKYFEILERMLHKFALAKEGKIYFSSKDLVRMSENFAKEVENIAKIKGGKLEIAREAKETDGGFILVYGGIEENCSFKALFEANRAELQDQVYQILFS